MKQAATKLCALALSLIFIFILSSASIPICAKDISEIELDFGDNASAVYFYSYDADRVLFSTGTDEILSPGPTAKIVTGLIACERFSNNLDKQVIITPEMLEDVSGNSMNLKTDMCLTVKELIYGAVCGGNNDAAQALAVLCGGTVEGFIDKMNAYAEKLYMKSTKFANPTGLDDENAYTTVEDIAKLAKHAAKNDLYMQISSASSYTVKPEDEEEFTVFNRNAFASQFSDASYVNKNISGIIAGRDDSGFSVVATCNKNDVHTLCIVMCADSDSKEIYSYYIANRLFEYATKNYSDIKLFEKDELMGKIDVNFAVANGTTATVNCLLAKDVYAFLPKNIDVDNDITCKVYFHDSAYNAPLYQNTVVGGVDFYYKDVLIGTGALVTQETVEANKILILLNTSKSFLTSPFVIVFVIILLLSVILYLIFKKRFYKHRTTRHHRFH